jgi:hypothetical protein
VLSTISSLRAASSRFTQKELFAISSAMPSPDLMPEANHQMLAEALAAASRAQQLPADWNTATQLGWQTRDAQGFESSWRRLNPLPQAVDYWSRAIGPLKGETPPQGAAGGPQKSYTAPGGQKYYQTPDGRWFLQ